MRRVIALSVLGLLLIGGIGCNDDTKVKPVYKTSQALIPTIEHADSKTIAVAPFDMTKVGDVIGAKSSAVFLGLGRSKTGSYKLAADMGKTIAEAFAFQLRQAGFKVTTLASATAPTEAGAGPCAVLTGAVTRFNIDFKVGFATQNTKGNATLHATLCGSDPNTPLYAGDSENARDFSKFMGSKSDQTHLADDLMTSAVDEVCKKPEFVDALRKLAATP